MLTFINLYPLLEYYPAQRSVWFCKTSLGQIDKELAKIGHDFLSDYTKTNFHRSLHSERSQYVAIQHARQLYLDQINANPVLLETRLEFERIAAFFNVEPSKLLDVLANVHGQWRDSTKETPRSVFWIHDANFNYTLEEPKERKDEYIKMSISGVSEFCVEDRRYKAQKLLAE